MYDLKFGYEFDSTINPEFMIEPGIPYIYMNSHNSTKIAEMISKMLPNVTCAGSYCFANTYCDQLSILGNISFKLGPTGKGF